MTRALRSLAATVLVALSFCSPLKAQFVQSFCSGPASLQNQYLEDAWYVAYDVQMHADSVQMAQTVPISTATRDSVLAAILGVYNADLPARDTVFQRFNIHAYKDIDLRRFEVYVDTTFEWARKLVAGQPTATGNYYADSLAQLYGFTVEFAEYFPEWVQDFDAIVRIRTASYINTDFMAEIMLGLDGVLYANPYTLGGDGNRIFYDKKADHTQMTFRRGWGDCPAGCLFQRDWLFRIYPGCTVEFVTSYGDSLGSSGSNAPIFAPRTRIAPNPANDRVRVDISGGLSGDFALATVSDLSGAILAGARLAVFNGAASGEIGLHDLPAGIYFLTLKNDNQIFTKKLIVHK